MAHSLLMPFLRPAVGAPDLNVTMNISLRKLDEELPTPSRAHPTDAGIDLYSVTGVELEPGERAVVPSGIAVAIPQGHAGLVVPRSGLAAKSGIGVVNAPGLIDPGYRGEIKIILVNHGADKVSISRGDRIAQLVVIPVALPEIEVVEDLGETSRGSRGLGSSGR
jgi:dUTP pyrophosphatase